MSVVSAVVLTDEQVAELTKLSRLGHASVPLGRRAHIVPQAAQGLLSNDIAHRMGIRHVQVAHWREHYMHDTT